MKISSLALALALTMFSNSAFSQTQAQSQEQQIESIKREILHIAEQASSRVKYDSEDNDPKVKAKLEVLVNKLVSIAPKRTQAEKLLDVVGAWRSVWSDLTYYGPFSPRVDSMYQVVFPTGYYYNLSIYDVPGGSYTSVIKGLFTVQEPALGIEFVKTSKYPKVFKNKSDLATLAMKAELGAFDAQVDPNNAPGIGFKSTFEQVYVDEDIRIGRGTNFTGANLLFILERASKFKRK